LIVCGQLAPNSIEIWQKLKNEGISLRILNISTPLHPDVEALKRLIEDKDVFVYEDHNVNSGLGNILADLILVNSRSSVCRIMHPLVQTSSFLDGQSWMWIVCVKVLKEC